MESNQGNTLEERLGKGPQQGSVGGQFGRNQFMNWNFPKREIDEDDDYAEEEEDVEGTEIIKLPVIYQIIKMYSFLTNCQQNMEYFMLKEV